MRRALLCAFVVGVLVALTGAPASAHASLLSSDPEEGSVVAVLPDQLVLTFNESVRLDQVQAFGPGGEDWAVDAEVQDNRLVVVPQEDPGTGTVVVAWKVLSEDGHVVGGSLTFSIGSPSSGVVADSSGAEASRGVEIARWAAVAVLAGALGAIVVLAALVAVRGTLPTRWTHHGLLRVLHLLWNVAFGAALALVPLNQLAAEGGSLRDAVDWVTWLDGLTRGTTWLLLISVLLAAGLVAAVRRTARPRHGSLLVLRVAVGALVAAVVVPLTVAVAAGPGSPSDDAAAVAVPAQGAGAQTAELGDAGTATVSARQTEGRSYRLRLTLTGPDGEPLRPYAKPTMSVTSDDVDLGSVELRRTGRGAYDADVVIPRDGEWSAEVSVRTTELDNPVAVVPFVVG